MAFCGQCGYVLPSGSAVCPRCGAPVDEARRVDDVRTDDATIASIARLPPGPQRAETAPPEQGKLILHPEDAAYGVRGPADPTSRADALVYRPPLTPPKPNVDTSYPVWPQSDAMGYAPASEPFGVQQPAPRRRRLTAILVVILLVVLLLLGTLTLFTLQYTGVLGKNPPSPTAANQNASQQAHDLIQQYYADINQKAYQDAYNTWWQNSQAYSDFAAGYAHTLHDDVTFDQITSLSDGTVQVNITVQAQEQGASGTVNSTYAGSYIVGQRGGAWKILSASFQKTGAIRTEQMI